MNPKKSLELSLIGWLIVEVEREQSQFFEG